MLFVLSIKIQFLAQWKVKGYHQMIQLGLETQFLRYILKNLLKMYYRYFRWPYVNFSLELLLQAFDPAYDSIFKTILPSGGAPEINSTKMSELAKGSSFLDLNSTEINSIFKNQTAAELNFMKNIEKLSSGVQVISRKFLKILC